MKDLHAHVRRLAAEALGQFGPATTDVLTLTGHPPTSVRALLESRRQALLHEMLEEISHHEPRLSGAKLELQGKDKDFMLHFLLTGVVNDAPCRLRLRFNTLSGQAILSWPFVAVVP